MAAEKSIPANFFEEMKQKYGKVYGIKITMDIDDETTESKEYVFKKPTAQSFDRLTKTLANSTMKAATAFVLDNIVDEQREMLQKDIEDFPGIPLALNDKLTGMLGLSKDVTVKKL